MNIKDLKQMIEGLPDEMPVVECRSGNTSCWTAEPDLTVRKVYKFNAIRNYGTKKGSSYQVEFCEVYTNNALDVVSEYDALVFYTNE